MLIAQCLKGISNTQGIDFDNDFDLFIVLLPNCVGDHIFFTFPNINRKLITFQNNNQTKVNTW